MQNLEPTRWENRRTDERSKAELGPILLATCALYSVICLCAWLFFQYPDDFWSFLIGTSIGIFIIYSSAFAFAIYSPWIARYINPTVVDPGYRGLISFRGEYTGEVAEPGIIVLPLFYKVLEIDCSPFSRTSGLVEVKSKDLFTIGASITARLHTSDPLLEVQSNNAISLCESVLQSALFAAASRRYALEIVADRDAVCDAAFEEVSLIVNSYGLSLDSISVDVVNTPADLDKLVGLLNVLKREHPEQSVSNLVDIIMVQSGKIGITRNDSTVKKTYEIPGLEEVLNAASKKFAV